MTAQSTDSVRAATAVRRCARPNAIVGAKDGKTGGGDGRGGHPASGAAAGAPGASAPAEEDPMEAIKRALEQDKKK